LCSPEELEAITYRRIHPKTVHLSTVFTRGVTTVLLLLSACGFDIEKVNNLRRDTTAAQFWWNKFLEETAISNI